MGKNKRLETLISNNCPRDEVIAFVIGKDSLYLPTGEDLGKLFDYIPEWSIKGGEDLKLNFYSQNDFSKESLENLVLKVRSDAFSCQNLLLLWEIAHILKRKQIKKTVLIGCGIIVIACVGAIFASCSGNNQKEKVRDNGDAGGRFRDKDNGSVYHCVKNGPVFYQDDDGGDVRDQNWDWHNTQSNTYGYNDKELNRTNWYGEDGTYDSSSEMLDKEDSDYYSYADDIYINDDKCWDD